MVYEEDILQFIPHAEGRWIDENGAFVPEYQYKDHLGNLRVSFREGQNSTYTAGMELANATYERSHFANVDITRNNLQKKTGLSSCRVSANAAVNKPLGTWKSIPVTKGDKITAKAYGFYSQAPTAGFSFNLVPFLQTATTYGNTSVSGENIISPFNPSQLLLGLTAIPNNPNGSTTVPNAYLRLVHYNGTSATATKVSEQVRHISPSFLNNWNNYLEIVYIAETNGRVEIFVANESDKDVWFDDIQITHTEHLIVQENHYYPFGMNLVGIEKSGIPDNKFQFSGKEKQSDFGMNGYDFGARFYTSDVPVWWQVDPKADEMRRWSPYNYAFCNPLRYIDPDGMKADDHIYINSRGTVMGITKAEGPHRLFLVDDAKRTFKDDEFKDRSSLKVIEEIDASDKQELLGKVKIGRQLTKDRNGIKETYNPYKAFEGMGTIDKPAPAAVQNAIWGAVMIIPALRVPSTIVRYSLWAKALFGGLDAWSQYTANRVTGSTPIQSLEGINITTSLLTAQNPAALFRNAIGGALFETSVSKGFSNTFLNKNPYHSGIDYGGDIFTGYGTDYFNRLITTSVQRLSATTTVGILTGTITNTTKYYFANTAKSQIK